MSDLVVVAFPTEEKAQEVGKKLLDLQQEYLIEVGDAVVATKRPNGPVKFKNLLRPAATTATNCTSCGSLIGMIILMPWAGISLGAVARTFAGALSYVGIEDRFIRQAAQRLQSGNAALVLVIRKMTNDKFIKALQGVGGRVLRTSFNQTKASALRQALASHSAASSAS